MPKKRALRWLIIIICLYLIVTTSQSIVDLWRAGDKLTNREAQLGQLSKKNQELSKEKKMVESPEFLEKVARNELGMGRPGERTIVVPPDLVAQAPQASADATPNWKKWVNLILN